MIIALAGRRVDPIDAKVKRFPLENAGLVEQRLRELFRARGARALVGSAACGADLIAQRVARELSLQRVIVLPYSAAAFRESSVTDRPGDWGSEFDELIAGARAGEGEVVELGFDDSADSSQGAYQAANIAILELALSFARDTHDRVLPVIVWDLQSRGPDDLTAAFGEAARARGLEPVEVSTIRK